jgi:hypothetical protein
MNLRVVDRLPDRYSGRYEHRHAQQTQDPKHPHFFILRATDFNSRSARNRDSPWPGGL